jgi:hypothetical protein
MAWKCPEGGKRYSSTLSWPRHKKGVGGQHHAPAALPPGNTRYPLYRRLGGPQGRSGRGRKISPPPGFDPRTVQPVASRYTDWATRPILAVKRYPFSGLWSSLLSQGQPLGELISRCHISEPKLTAAMNGCGKAKFVFTSRHYNAG